MRCSLRHCRLEREGRGRSERVLIVFMNKVVVGDGIREALSHTWEDGDRTAAKLSPRMRVGSPLIFGRSPTT